MWRKNFRNRIFNNNILANSNKNVGLIMVVYFAFLFHIYQPPVQIPAVLKYIVNESYKPIMEKVREMVNKNKKSKRINEYRIISGNIINS